MNQYPIMLLHGWGFSSHIWRPLIQSLHTKGCDDVYVIDLPGFGSAFHEPCGSLDKVIDFIVEQLPSKSILCGWSLGGMLAVKIAERWPEKISAIVTVGSNLHFTQTDNWPGMPQNDFREFCRRFSEQPEKTWRRFLKLQTKGDSHVQHSDNVLDQLADYSAINQITADKMLALLGEIDNRQAFETLTMQGLHILAEHDAITPAAIAPLLRKINPNQTVELLSGCGHAMPVSCPDKLATSIANISEKEDIAYPENTVGKSRIADSFSRAAHSYDSAAQLQRNVGAALIGALPDTINGQVIDIGCGTGFISNELLKKYGAHINVVAMDIAAGMLELTQHSHANIACVQADMEFLPFATQCADWIFSNLALQWASNPTQCFQQWHSVLKSGGQLCFSTFLPGTLCELEQSWKTVDDAVHVNHFVGEDALLDALHTAGFTVVETVRAKHTLYYPALRDLATELKAIGAHNMNAGQPAGLTGKKRWQQLQSAYEFFRTARGLPATYEVLYVSAS